MKLKSLIILIITSISYAETVRCFFYRVRADEGFSPENLMERNCSSTANDWCVKIVARNEITGLDSESTNSIEGRCAFSSHECEERQNKCTSEPPSERYGITIHEHKCCSRGDLSNKMNFNFPVLLISMLIVKEII